MYTWNVLYPRRASFWSLFAASVFLLWAWEQPGRATTFVPGEPEPLFHAADAVVLGRVTALESVTTDSGTFTNVTLSVERSLKAPTENSIVLTELGGDTPAGNRWVFGSPTYFVGERVLLFLHVTRDGALRSLYLGMGKFRVVRASSGREYAVQNLTDSLAWNHRTRRMQRAYSRSYPLEVLWQRLEAVPTRRPRRFHDRLAGNPVRGSVARPRFAFTGPPAVRWFAPDRGETVQFAIDRTGDQTIGPHNSIQAATDALAAWSNAPCSSLRLEAAGEAVPRSFASCDGKSQILFNDPFDDIPDPTDCIGVLGVGGVCGNKGDLLPFAGSSFFEISEGDVVIANGFGACPFWNIPGLAEVVTHELGHAIGLAHSSDDPAERDPLRADATMYYRAHFDYRGAALRDDDQAAVCALYPANGDTTIEVQRAALVLDPQEADGRNRLLVTGTFRVHDPAWQVALDPFFFSVRDGATFLVDADIRPQDWLRNVRGNRFRWRARTALGVVVLDLVQLDPQTYEFTLVARSASIEASQSGSFTLSATLGDASATVPLYLRPRGRALLFP